MKIQQIALSKLVTNTGQIEGLPKNPRLIKDDRYRKLVKSIVDDPEMLELRELIVYPLKGKYVVVCGNMRLKALGELEYTEAPCKVLPEGTTVAKMAAYAVKDNVPFGEHDFDILVSEWTEFPLEDWGVTVPDWKGMGTEFELPDGDRAPFQQMTFTLSDQQATLVKLALKEVKSLNELPDTDNENSNGNALYQIAREWQGLRKSA